MKRFFTGIICLISFFISAQDEYKIPDNDKKTSKHEVGLNFQNSSLRSSFIPQISYNFYRRESNVLHFSLSGQSVGYAKAIGFEFWNEYRNYLGRRNKWFVSHGLILSAGYSEYSWRTGASSSEAVSYGAVGFGYKVGVGYKINERFNLTTTAKLGASYFNSNNDKYGSKWDINPGFNLGVNYRF